MHVNIERMTAPLLPFAIKAFRAQSQIGKQRLSPADVDRGIEVLRKTISDLRQVTWLAFDADKNFLSYMVQFFPHTCPNHWLMPFLVTNPDMHLPWDYSKNGMEQLWIRGMSFGKYYNCHNVLWSLPTAWVKTTERTRRTSKVWKNYDIHAFGEVQAGELPENPFDRVVFGQNPKSYDVTLRCAWPTARPGLEVLEGRRAQAAQAKLDASRLAEVAVQSGGSQEQAAEPAIHADGE